MSISRIGELFLPGLELSSISPFVSTPLSYRNLTAGAPLKPGASKVLARSLLEDSEQDASKAWKWAVQT